MVTYGFAQTDDEGKYEFDGFDSGGILCVGGGEAVVRGVSGWVDENGVKSRVETVAPELNVAYATTFYNGATEADGALRRSRWRKARAWPRIFI